MALFINYFNKMINQVRNHFRDIDNISPILHPISFEAGALFLEISRYLLEPINKNKESFGFELK